MSVARTGSWSARSAPYEHEDEDVDDVFPNDDDDDDSTIGELSPRVRISSPPQVGTGRILPARFRSPSSAQPSALAPRQRSADNGGPNPRAGWSFVFKPLARRTAKQATGQNCAPLLPLWDFGLGPAKGADSLVIATDSEYVVEGYAGGWMTRMGAAVKNRDLWERLLGEIERWHEHGLDIAFWRIPREWNTDADYHARHAASHDRADAFQEVRGVLV
ncbi:hypothetical protein N8T08_005726 [Aspergillus melleus]|uniref:Uncharacterized protein n=1 Tax=Aspergillus melleus TaxID=138277 RepID=A0ACC3B1U7_9EURO|nr:hypothetical protein N8T08_005726 [Aspergillus melleus]